MSGAGKRGGIKVCLAIGLSFLAWNSLKVARTSHLDSDEADLERGRALLPLNAAYSQGLARQALVAGDASKAASLAEEAIRLFPFRGSTWLDLAEVRLKQGDREGVLDAVRKAAMLGPTKGKWRWRAALMLLQAGWTEQAVGELAAVARVDGSRRHSAYDLAWTVFDDPQEVLRKIVPEDDGGRLDYLSYLIRTRRVDAVVALWPLTKQAASLRERYSYIDFLLTNGVVREAWAAWIEAFPQARAGAIHNGDFARAVVGHGFGWRLGRPDGVALRVVRQRPGGKRALELRFEGGNPTFDHSHQVVRVSGGERYRLSALVRWEGVTSASQPHLYVQGYRQCPGLAAESRGLRGSGEGTIEVRFLTPPGCEAIVVGLRRLRTRKLDRNIEGTIWLTNVDLARLSHQLPAATPRCRLSTASRLENVAGVPFSAPPPAFRRAPCIQTTLQSLAAEPGDKLGLEREPRSEVLTSRADAAWGAGAAGDVSSPGAAGRSRGLEGNLA